jgi:UPF0755 protein
VRGDVRGDVGRRENSRGRFVAVAGALVIGVVIALAAVGLWIHHDWRTPYGEFSKGGLFVEIPRGTSRAAIAELLASNDVIRSSASFRLLASINPRANLRAGEYLFDRPRTPQEIFRMLIEGRVYLHTFTVPEGYTLLDIADTVARERLATREAFLAAARDPEAVRDLAPKARTLEGFLFPDTYKFPRGVTPQKIAEAMVHRFRQVWGALPEKGPVADGPGALEIITMASLVERETAVLEERPRVASVFYNRLRQGVALDCDPTVIYALRQEGLYTGKLNSSDLRFDSPYNTYQHRGLPPGPIANPGEASLRAALAPENTDYFYFVADAEGHHVFSRTLAEHNRNVARYRRRLAAIAREGAHGSTATASESRQSP